MNKLLLAVLLWLSMLAVASSQERRVQNKPYIDERRFHYGFFVGVHDQAMRILTIMNIMVATCQQAWDA